MQEELITAKERDGSKLRARAWAYLWFGSTIIPEGLSHDLLSLRSSRESA